MKRNNIVIKRLSIWALFVTAILTIPLLAKFPWTLGDYIFAGVVLFGSATVYEVSTRNVTNYASRIVVGFAVVMFVLFIWAWAVA